jgi:hypothetical protein
VGSGATGLSSGLTASTPTPDTATDHVAASDHATTHAG